MKAYTCLTIDFLALLVVLNFTAAAASYDWPQWRGPNRDGVTTETGLLKQWPAGGPKLLWKAQGIGKGYATVAVVGDRVFTAGDKGASSFVFCLSATSGTNLWSSKLGKAGSSGWGGFEGPRSTPTVENGLVFATGQWGELGCYDAATSQEKWRKDYPKDFGGQPPEWGFSESPPVDGGNVVV